MWPAARMGPAAGASIPVPGGVVMGGQHVRPVGGPAVTMGVTCSCETVRRAASPPASARPRQRPWLGMLPTVPGVVRWRRDLPTVRPCGAVVKPQTTRCSGARPHRIATCCNACPSRAGRIDPRSRVLRPRAQAFCPRRPRRLSTSWDGLSTARTAILHRTGVRIKSARPRDTQVRGFGHQHSWIAQFRRSCTCAQGPGALPAHARVAEARMDQWRTLLAPT